MTRTEQTGNSRKTALIIGATGGVGGAVARTLYMNVGTGAVWLSAGGEEREL